MVNNYCVGGVPQSDETFDYPRVFQGDLVRLKWHSKRNENETQDKCLLSFPDRSYRSPWIAVIIEDKSNQAECSLSELLNQSITFINASTVIFLRDDQAAFNQPVLILVTPSSCSPFGDVEDTFNSQCCLYPPLNHTALSTESPFTSYSSSFHTPFARHHLDHRQRNRGGLERSGGEGSTLPFPPPLLISLPLDMFSDLPSQLAVASNSTQVAVTGDIVLFAESLTTSNLSTVEANNGNNASDLSSSLLLLLIVCVLFLLLGILLVPARLGICFWQRFCSFSISRSAKSRRSVCLNYITIVPLN
ncbi:unnamed protein product [Hymenolepis diminuta]|uniref:Uncharacterized protein n=1 Tax=Hymenolepis diminuta TaxID=6216 RepID=A0A0R3SQA0_HYMDI|nr:unnamed protein product [Hymenolepis diminuta]